MIHSHTFRNLVNFFHFYYTKYRYFAPVLFFILVFLPFFSGSLVYGQNVFGTVKTPLTVAIDGETKHFVTSQSNLYAGLEQGGISLAENDITEPATATELTGKALNVKVIRALPVLIADNNQQFPETSAYSDPNAILEQLQITIYPEDKVSSELILDPADEQAVGQKIIIDRAPVYAIHVDNKTLTVRSWSPTVQGVLDGRVSLGLRDIVEPPVTATVRGGDVTITRINVVDVTENEAIDFQTNYQDNYYVPQGVERTITAGKPGSKKNLVRIRYENGVIVSRTVINSTVTANPVTEVVARGLMPSGHPDFDSTYWRYMVQAGSRYGISPLDLYKVAVCESHVNPYSAGAYYGMYQYNLGFWQQASAAAGFAGASWKDAKAQIFSTARYASINGWGRWGCKP